MSCTWVNVPVWISYFRPTICVVFLIRGEALMSAMSSLTLSSILYAWLVTNSLENPTLNLRASDFSKFRSFNRRFLFRCKFGQCLFYCAIVEMCHSAIYICELCNTSYGRVGNTSVVHNNNCSGSSNSLKNSHWPDRVESSTTSIADHSSFYISVSIILSWRRKHGCESLLRVFPSMPKTWYGFRRGSEHDKTTTPAPLALIGLISSNNGGGDW